MVLSPVIVVIIICISFSTINSCLSMVIPSSITTNDILSNVTTTSFPTTIANVTQTTPTSPPTHILRVRIRVHHSLIETLLHKKQLDLIENQLRQRHIPYRQIQDNKDGITIIIGPFHKSTNLTATMMMFNQSRFHANFTKMIPIEMDDKNQTNGTIHLDEKTIHIKHFPISVVAHEYNLTYDQESFEFRNCLEVCEVYEDNEFKPDHNCIRKKCLKEITGI